jgi:predicted enzyme related to lactoylglutathione lyase
LVQLSLNWFGMAVHDFISAAAFYGERLRFSFVDDEAKGFWRYFQTQRMTFELFEAHPQRLKVKAWGNGQAFRPVLLVDNLAASAGMLEKQGILFSRSDSESGHRIEMVGPEQIRWSLMESADHQMDWAHPTVAGIELKAVNLDRQKKFYRETLGMTVAHENANETLLIQPEGEAWLRIEAGGVPTPMPAPAGEAKPAFFYPIWISFETGNVKQANVWLQEQKATILHPLTYHEDWDGTDIILADMDGNAIQVVEYGKAESL